MLHDLRVGSRTDGATEVIDLDGDVDQGVYIPPGVAHGFAALSDVLLTYLVDNYYDDSDEHGLAWDDPAVRPTGASPTRSSPSGTRATRGATTSPTTSAPACPPESPRRPVPGPPGGLARAVFLPRRVFRARLILLNRGRC